MNDDPPFVLRSILGGEPILWWGRPNKAGLVLGRNPLLLVLFAAAPVAVAALFYDWFLTDRDPVYLGFGLVALVWGEYVVANTVRLRLRAARETLYAITAKRVLIVSPALKRGGLLAPLDHLLPYRVERSVRGLKHIIFTPPDRLSLQMFSGFCDCLPVFPCSPGFYFLDDETEVVSLLRELIERLQDDGSAES